MKRAGTTNGRLLVISILGSAFAAGTLALGMHYAGLETYPLLASMPYRKLVFTCSSPRFSLQRASEYINLESMERSSSIR